MSGESIKPPAASNNSLTPVLNHTNTKLKVILDRSCLKQEKLAFTHKNMVSIYIVFKINLWSNIQGVDFALEYSLFGALKLTKKGIIILAMDVVQVGFFFHYQMVMGSVRA